jgi:hypothetical protein
MKITYEKTRKGDGEITFLNNAYGKSVGNRIK